MTRYGILSIVQKVPVARKRPFTTLYQMIGKNTGNLLFTNAVWNQIGGNKERVSFTFSPELLNETLDALVIPAANWLSPFVDFSTLADLFEQLTIPTILIGIGAQDDSYSGAVAIPEGTQRFVKAISERSESISVRGQYTQEILSSLGVQNTTVTGCPSLYHDFRPFFPPGPVKVRQSKGLIHSTRYSATYEPFANEESIHRQLFRIAFQEGMDILIQSEPEEMSLLVQATEKPAFDAGLKALLKQIYDAPDWPTLKAYIREQGRTFFDVDTWARALDSYDYVFGTRLHGTIMALNSGVPAYMLHHDSRTREICEFAAIPSSAARGIQLTPRKMKGFVENADFGSYYSKRETNKLNYKAFLARNGLVASDF
ncbi:polysaccharide pyruvyl transferase family protein [Hyphomonas johnsonii]|uniref:Polysaccharide pyruvyl transferase domain-containing protein n=1 Tax=Hyphomonas johnsonii MHS-2 TaxID=1280950 RepID=A0A059FAG2_9PROT|nr:polysaccharide pyruvyl transferase family protein [Hyphomonas johnsonii]KCZ87587.1 hypothetical protein HJO_16480 [Hyphomonas johnsonii MHS-2]